MMLSPELCARIYRSIENRLLKVVALGALRRLGVRHFVTRLDTTNLCNLHCRMCYYSGVKKRRPLQMDLTLFGKIAEEMFPRTRFLYLSCATEPLMNPHFAHFLDRIRAFHVPFTSFCTNGMLLTEVIVESAIRSGLSEIIFSVDGATAGTYEFIRRGAKWSTLCAKLLLLRAKKEEARSVLPAARINFTCMQCNIHELPALIRFAAEHGVFNVHVRHLFAFNAEKDETTWQEQVLYRNSYNQFAREAQDEASRVGVRVVLADQVPEKPSERRAARPAEETNPFCVAPWCEAIITPEGNYRLCSALPSFGNLRDHTFTEIYRSERLRRLRQHLLRRDANACSRHCDEDAASGITNLDSQ